MQQILEELQTILHDRLAHWPPEWQGFHWPGYTYEHTFRVCNLARRLALLENANLEVVTLAALLHDIEKPVGKEHAAAGAVTAGEILERYELVPELCEQVIGAIACHAGDNTVHSPVENRVLADADLIDANFGVVALWRFITIRAGNGARIEDTVEGMAHWHERKQELLMLTCSVSGRECALERHQAMGIYVNEFVELFDGGQKGKTDCCNQKALFWMLDTINDNYTTASLNEHLRLFNDYLTHHSAPALQQFCTRLKHEIEGSL